MKKNNIDINNIPQEMFELAPEEGRLHDKKLETKSIGYFKDAFIRFRKNKASIVAAIIVIILIIFAIVGPYCYNRNYVKSYSTDTELQRYRRLLPKLPFMNNTGIWDGTNKDEMSQAKYDKLEGIGVETGHNPIVKVLDTYDKNDGTFTTTMYKCRVNQYYKIDCFTKTLTSEEYFALQEWQNANGLQIILPWVDYYSRTSTYDLERNSKVKMKDLNIWFECDTTGKAVRDADGNLIPAYRTTSKDDYTSLRLESDPAYTYTGDDVTTVTNRYRYALRSGTSENLNYTVRLNAYNYFMYKYGFEPYYVFGSDDQGYDILTRLASGARFSLLFALCVSAVNLFIGAIYGSIEGYYGGAADMIMERISDILSAIPGMVVTVLINLHFSGKIGAVAALLFSFVLTGWIGMASRTRMQFYRFKNQEYVLAARTLGANDRRIMFKHIFPNSLGTLITGSVLVIPGVIFSETSLTYLGIINLDSPTRSSVGAMLSAGQKLMTSYPHMVFFPALFIGLLMVSFNLFGNGLRDAFNPSLRGAEE